MATEYVECVRAGCTHSSAWHKNLTGKCLMEGCTCEQMLSTRNTTAEPSVTPFRSLQSDIASAPGVPNNGGEMVTLRNYGVVNTPFSDNFFAANSHVPTYIKFTDGVAYYLNPENPAELRISPYFDGQVPAVGVGAQTVKLNNGTQTVAAGLAHNDTAPKTESPDSSAPVAPTIKVIPAHGSGLMAYYDPCEVDPYMALLQAEAARLRKIVEQIDDVFTVNWVAVVDNDYHAAMYRWLTLEMQIDNDPSVSPTAKNRQFLMESIKQLVLSARDEVAIDSHHSTQTVVNPMYLQQVKDHLTAVLADEAAAEEIASNRVDSVRIRNRREKRVLKWMLDCFEEHEVRSLPQRGLRLLEESTEAAQAAGVTQAEARKVIDYVYSRPVGNLAQELGGVGVTVLALASIADLSADECETKEVLRILAKPREHFQKRNAEKNAAGLTVESLKPLDRHIYCGGCECAIRNAHLGPDDGGELWVSEQFSSTQCTGWKGRHYPASKSREDTSTHGENELRG